MTIQLTDSELKALVKTHISGSINVPEDRLKVTFTKRQTQTDTSIEILKEGQAKSIIMEPVDKTAELINRQLAAQNIELMADSDISETSESTDNTAALQTESNTVAETTTTNVATLN